MTQIEYLFPAALLVHFLGDFVVQSYWKNGWCAREKWHNWRALTEHVLTYVGIFPLLIFVPGLKWPVCILLIVVNGLSHFGIDAVTSRLTHSAVKGEKISDIKSYFWVVIGADQLAHMLILYWSCIAVL